jgi:hypothetical protein
MTYPSKTIKDAARQVLVQKHQRHIRPLAVTAREIQQLCPGIAGTDVENELAALALADGCRLSTNINKEIMLIWEI